MLEPLKQVMISVLSFCVYIFTLEFRHLGNVIAFGISSYLFSFRFIFMGLIFISY